jgi:xanthine dehydrogenase small subunit
MSDAVRFLLDGEVRELRDVDPTLTVLNYLRMVERRSGTKEGCAEGDCGACTVAIGERIVRGDGGDGVRYRAINSCIQFVPTLDGKELVTVESLKEDGKLHPAQQAMVECHGSQCGFCTPGFVMSLFTLFHGDAPADRDGIEDALAGNLCRCTGYRPIIAAAERMRALADTDSFSAREAETARQLRAIARADTLTLEKDGRRYFAPKTIAAFAALVEQYPDAVLLAGGTDVGLWVTKQHKNLAALIYTGDVAELRQLKRTETAIEIGAAVPYSDAIALLTEEYADFGELLRRLGSVQIRNAGTMGGNIGNASPIGDTPPLLIALDARLVLRRGDATREMPIEDFFLAYRKTALAAGEFIASVRVPLARPEIQFRAYKISKRFDQDISAVCGTFALRLEGGRVADIRIAFGGMAATPKRAAAAEAALARQAWTETAVRAAMRALDRDFQPIGDMRASAEYRQLVARNLLLKFFLETAQKPGATRILARGKAA